LRSHRTIPLVIAAVLALASSRAQAEAPWSAAASGGLVFPVGQRYGGTNAGGWVDLLHTAVPNWSIGAEAGWFALPGESYDIPTDVGYNGSTRRSFGMYSASAVVRGRSPGMVRFHMLGTVGYYDLATRTLFAGARPDQVEHEWSPGFSLGIGFSGSELVRPGFQLRWHETVSPDHVNMDLVTFEVGLHFN
jgi:hypothetical protein